MINQNGIRAWQKGFECLWKQEGVWTVDDKDTPVLINPYYFSEVNGEKVNFNKDYLKVIDEYLNPYVDSLQTKYSEQVRVFTRVLFESGLNPGQKSKLLKQLFEDFRAEDGASRQPVKPPEGEASNPYKLK